MPRPRHPPGEIAVDQYQGAIEIGVRAAYPLVTGSSGKDSMRTTSSCVVDARRILIRPSREEG
jgi:hypothetical protein